MTQIDIDVDRVRDYLTGLQQRIVERVEALDGKSFRRDAWQRAGGGGGLSCVLEEGQFLERGGVGFSHVQGHTLPPSASASRPELAGRSFQALGVSLVFHPRNPYVPTVHMNVRFFIATTHAVLCIRGRCQTLSPHVPRCAAALRQAILSSLQGLV
jgi:coproporphyrinogen III oxidase